MGSQNPDIIVAGHICLDMFPQFKNEPGQKIGDLLRPGTLLKMGGIHFSTGGPVSNTGIALKKFGNRVGFIAKVGDDMIGSIITGMLRKEGKADAISVARGETTSYTVVVAPVGIDRIFLHCPGTNDTFVSSDIDYDLVGQAKLFHLGYPTLMDALHANEGAELEAIYRQAKKTGVTTSMDISLPDPNSPAGKADWPAIYRKVLPYVDIFVPSIEEAMLTLDVSEWAARRDATGGNDLLEHIQPDEYCRIASDFIGMGCAIVALKAGHKGWYLQTAGAERIAGIGKLAPAHLDDWAAKQLWCPAFSCKEEEVASATGAGDAAIAGFLTSLIRQFSPQRSLKMANCAGYMNLRELDALSGLGSWEEMEEQVDKLVVRNAAGLQDFGWQFDTESGVWYLD